MDHASIPLARKGRPRSAVRVIMFPQAYGSLMEVARSGLPVETSGLLVGTIQEQGGYTWLWVRSIEPLAIVYDGLRPGFDRERLAAVRNAIAAGASPRPVGWYYSDPGMGVFPPRLDLREAHHDFGPGMPIMLAVNPSTEQGVFLEWRGGRFVPSGGFYEALEREGAEPTIPWGGGLPANWRSLAEGTGILLGEEEGEGGIVFDADTSPDTTGGDEWTDKFDTSPFSSAPYDLPDEDREKRPGGSLDTPPTPLTIDDLMAPGPPPGPPASEERTAPAVEYGVIDTGPVPYAAREETDAAATPETPGATTPIPPAPPPVPSPATAERISAVPPAASAAKAPVVKPQEPQAAVQPEPKVGEQAPAAAKESGAKPKAPPALDIKYTSIDAARSAQSAVAAPSQHDTQRLDDLRDYIHRIDPERAVDPEEEARWLSGLRTGQLDDEALREELERQKRARRVPLSRRLMSLVLPVLLVAIVGVALYFGWPALTSALQNINRPTPTQVPLQVTQPPLATPEQARAFPETGFTVSQPLLGFWRANGGLPIFGYPISDRVSETTQSGDPIEVQYFERSRLEIHPEASGRPDYVRTGPIGLEAPKAGTPMAQLPEGLAGAQVLFGETNFSVPEKFFNFWTNSGAKVIFGVPITGVLSETIGGVPLAVQYFERARFEYHPEAAGTPGDITLGLLGAEVYRQKHPGP